MKYEAPGKTGKWLSRLVVIILVVFTIIRIVRAPMSLNIPACRGPAATARELFNPRRRLDQLDKLQLTRAVTAIDCLFTKLCLFDQVVNAVRSGEKDDTVGLSQRKHRAV
ncbi:MAG TPA: hypothetical protein PKI71_15765, partial [Candidatus Rifleibacterium sp.]|nr:hypothetical protein [Candidatus Rifleibacterium sp.]